MNFAQKIKEFQETLNEKELNFAFLDAEYRSKNDNNIPKYPIWYFSPVKGIPRPHNTAQLRDFKKSVWVQMCINTIKKNVKQTDWDIIVDDDTVDSNHFKDDIKYAKEFLDHPNRMEHYTFDDLVDGLLDDILTIDAGVWYLNMEGENLIEILNYDASTFLKEQDEHGFLINWWQFSYKVPMQAPMLIPKENIVYFQLNNRTYNPYGFSPLESVQQVIELLDESTRYNKDFFLNNAIPALIMALPNLNKESLNKVYSEWMNRFQGKPHKILLHNADDQKIEHISLNNRDMEWLDGQKWFMHIAFAIYGLSPAEAGFYDDVNRASQEGQERITVKNGVLPYLRAIEQKINRMVLPAIFGERKVPIDKRRPLSFKYFPKDSAQESIEHQQELDDVRAKILTVNEVRKKRGLEPLKSEYANDPYKMSDDMLKAGGSFENNASKGNKEENDKKSESDGRGKDSSGIIIINKEVDSRDEDAKDYSEFFDKMLDSWESSVLRATSQIHKSYNDKSFNDFVSQMLNSMITIKFFNKLVDVIKRTMKDGISQAEDDLDVDVGTDPLFEERSEHMARQQFDGYMLQTGEKWIGIKGLNRKMQIDIYNQVKEGMENKESNDKIKDRIMEVFKGVKEGRAMVIARTETARMQNEAKMTTYKNSKVSGKKEYVAFSGCCEFCTSLNGQIRELSEPFETEGKTIAYPPTHPNCRCFVRFVRD